MSQLQAANNKPLEYRSINTFFTIGCIKRGWFFFEIKKLLKLSVSISLSILLQISLLWISLLFLGHLPDKTEADSYQYAAAGLGSSFLNITGISLGHGIASASDTLSSQAFGCKNYKRVGVVLQRGILIMGLALFPIIALWLNTESLLLLAQQAPCVARFGALYVEFFSLAIPFTFLYILLQHYLQSQGIVWQFVLIGLISNIVCVVLHTITIYGLELRFTGAVASLIISEILPPLLVIGYVWYRKLHKVTWGGWSFESLQEWWLFTKLAVPGMLMVILEWGAFEAVNFLAGVLGETELSANIVWFQVVELLYIPCLGVGIATSIRVGNELGAGNPVGAKRASYTALSITLIISVSSSILLLATNDVLGDIFVPGNEEVADQVSTLMLYTCWIFLIFDQMQTVIAGVLRSSGRQYIGAVVGFVSYYIVGLPLGVALGFKTELKLVGLWIGMVLGSAIQCTGYLVVLVCTDWKKVSDKAVERARQSEEPNTREVSVSVTSSAGSCDHIYSPEQTSVTEETASVTSETSSKSFGSVNNDEEETTSIISQTSSGSRDKTDEDNLISGEDSELQKEENEDRDQNQFTEVLYSKTRAYKLRKLLLHGSFFVVGVSILIAGGVSSTFHPHVDQDQYSNCTVFDNSSFIV